MKMYDLGKMKKKLQKYLDEDRYEHTMGVMYTGAALAMAYGVSVEDAKIAGLLHDCAKCIPNKDKTKLCKKYKIPVTAFEAEHPYLLHAKMGAYLARNKYGVTDSEILKAIIYHTTGRADMSVLEKIIYIADYIEPMRYKAPRLAQIRQLAFQDLDECMYEILKDTLAYLECNPQDIDKATQVAFDFYEGRHMERQRKGEIAE